MSKFLTKSEFGKLVEKSVLEQKNNYMDVVLDLCDKHQIDPEDVKKFLSPIIVEKIAAEAMVLNLIPAENQLHFD